MDNINSENYEEMVKRLIKPGEEILATLTPEKVNLWHMATGIATEAGELLSAVKDHIVYNKKLDLKNIKEESGDLEFYMTGIRQAIKTSRMLILAINQGKLSGDGGRYEDGYSDEAAQIRADKEKI